MCQTKIPLDTKQRAVLETGAWYTDSDLVAIDDEHNFYVVGDMGDEVHFTTYSLQGGVIQDRHFTAETARTELGISEEDWGGPPQHMEYWMCLHYEFNVFGTDSRLYFANANCPFPYRSDLKSEYLLLGNFDIAELEKIDNPCLPPSSARHVLDNLELVDEKGQRAILRALNSHWNNAFESVVGLYADVPKAWTFPAPDLCMVTREQRLLLDCRGGGQETVQMALAEVACESEQGSYTWGRLPLAGIEWISGVQQFFRTEDELFSSGGVRNSYYDHIIRQHGWDEAALRRSIGDHSTEYLLLSYVGYAIAGYSCNWYLPTGDDWQ